MKAFRLEKTLKGSSGLHVRLGCYQFAGGKAANDGASSSDTDDTGGLKINQEPYRTPMYFIHTQTGTVPHITPEVFKLIYPTSGSNTCSQAPPLQISIDSTLRFAESLEKFEKGIAQYVGFSGLPTFLTIHDPLQALRCGHNDKFGIALWSRHGRSSLTPERFVALLKTYNCNISQIISDYDVRSENGLKRFRKSLSRAEEYTSFVLKNNSTADQKPEGLFITVEAAWFKVAEDLAKKTVANMLESQQNIEGIVIAGITKNLLKTEDPNAKLEKEKNKHSSANTERLSYCQDINEEIDLLEKVMQVIPSHLPKFVPGPFSLHQILELMARGVDIFDSSIASRMSDDGKVFILDEVEKQLHLLCKSVKPSSDCVNESLSERVTSEGNQNKQVEGSLNMIPLKEKRFFDDFGPISNSCNCYTCRKHTRSYIHHLFATNELLGPVLIQMHNLTTLDRFFKIMRGIIDDSDTPEELQEKFVLMRKLIGEEANVESSDKNEKITEQSKA